MFFLSCVCYVFVCVCLFVPCGHLLGKGLLQKETRRSQDSMNIPKIYCITYIFTFIINI